MMRVTSSMFRQLRGIGAEFPPAVSAAKAGRQGRDLFGFARLGRRHHHERQLQQIELAALLGRHLHVVEGRRLLGEPRDRFDERLRGARVQRLAVLRDVRLRDPARLRRLQREPLQRRVDVAEKLPRLVRCATGGRPAGAAGHDGRRRDERECQGCAPPERYGHDAPPALYSIIIIP
jgi:hypothetical protein